MTLREEAMEAVGRVPEAKLPMLIEFARFLKFSADKEVKQLTEQKPEKRNRPRLWGALEGKVYMSGDFNDKLEYVSPRELAVLEAMRADTTGELQKVAV